MSMRFQTGEGPSRGLLRYCENFADGSLAALIVLVFPPCCHYPPGEEISRTRLTAAYNLFRGGKQFICDANYERGSSILGAHQHLPIQRHTILTSSTRSQSLTIKLTMLTSYCRKVQLKMPLYTNAFCLPPTLAHEKQYSLNFKTT